MAQSSTDFELTMYDPSSSDLEMLWSMGDCVYMVVAIYDCLDSPRLSVDAYVRFHQATSATNLCSRIGIGWFAQPVLLPSPDARTCPQATRVRSYSVCRDRGVGLQEPRFLSSLLDDLLEGEWS